MSYLTSDLCLFVAVTTTNQAIKALEMLRKNINKFDLLTSDVNMPDMDGLKLLELVGLQMGLPVISKLKHLYSVFTFIQLEFNQTNLFKFDFFYNFLLSHNDGINLNSYIFVCNVVLSAYNNKERVMRGVIQGACEYLTKPVRIEELQNIWQHVLRRRIDSKDKNKIASKGKKAAIWLVSLQMRRKATIWLRMQLSHGTKK